MKKRLTRRIKKKLRSSGYLSIRTAIILVIFAFIVGVAGMMVIEDLNFVDAIYMTVITISTVGYGEVAPLSHYGKVFISVLILLNIGVFSYGISAFTYFVIEGEYFKNLSTRMSMKTIKKLNDHVIVCGYGRYGIEITSQLEKHKTPFVAVDIDESKFEHFDDESPFAHYMVEDATKDQVLITCGIDKAQALISALPDDTDNLFTVLSARQLNPSLEIISRARNQNVQSKLLLAGASHVVLPDQIGGFYMAHLVSKPNATEFFTFLTEEMEHDIGIEELSFDSLPRRERGKPISQMTIREETGVNIIGYKVGDIFEINPHSETILEPGTTFLVLGNGDQLEKLEHYLKT